VTVSPYAHLAAYGGHRWAPRHDSLVNDIGSVWAPCGIDSEYGVLRSVLLHRPGLELALNAKNDPDSALFIEVPNPERAAAQHDVLASVYREHHVEVVYVDPPVVPPPNLMFVEDLFAMTTTGAILARPASLVRSGEERCVARRLADIGIPILRSVSGDATFEGGDLCWVDPKTVLVGRGIRTNDAGARQVAAMLAEIDVETIIVDLPHSSMHLMGDLRFFDKDLAFIRSGRTPWRVIQLLREKGFEVHLFPDKNETFLEQAHNVVTLGPRKILMPANGPISKAAYEAAGVECITVEMDEIHKCAGGIACLTGILSRDSVR
jgi:N-dimethylarginine dimethylaminohydrolase